MIGLRRAAFPDPSSGYLSAHFVARRGCVPVALATRSPSASLQKKCIAHNNCSSSSTEHHSALVSPLCLATATRGKGGEWRIEEPRERERRLEAVMKTMVFAHHHSCVALPQCLLIATRHDNPASHQ